MNPALQIEFEYLPKGLPRWSEAVVLTKRVLDEVSNGLQ